jgi:hypothetical protein
MTTNLEITRAALEEKKAALQTRVDELNTTRQQTINDRAHNLLASALSVYSPTEIIITNGYSESIYINVVDSKDRRTEILSIHTRSYGTNYLNTYSTTISDEFELKRLVFNGKVAELFLNDSEFYNKLFAPTEIDEECTRLNDELHSVDGTLRETKRAITQAFVDDQINKLKAGQEIEFKDLKTLTYGRGKWECVFRVVKMKAEWVSNKKANVTFTCKQWGDDEYEIITRPGVLDKYLISALHYSQ